jgi:hypothetical protein
MKIKIAIEKNEKIEIDAITVGRYFSVHATNYKPEDKPKKDSYTVTLNSCGVCVVGGIPWVNTAKQLAKELEALVSREVIDAQYAASSDPKKAVRGFPQNVIDFCKAVQYAAWGASLQKDLDIDAIKLQYLGKESVRKIVQGSLL